MTIEVAMLISIISFLFSTYQGVQNMKRSSKKDDREETQEVTGIMFELKNISRDTQEIKKDIKDVKADVKQHSENIIRMDESLKSAWKRINLLEGRKEEG